MIGSEKAVTDILIEEGYSPKAFENYDPEEWDNGNILNGLIGCPTYFNECTVEQLRAWLRLYKTFFGNPYPYEEGEENK